MIPPRNGFLFAGALRYVWVLHCTWSVNSIVHSDFGPSVYDENEPPSESRLVSFLALGEGWHSWHHAFAFDYSTSELGATQQYNPTKIFIDTCANIGLVWNRKTGQRMWGEKKKKMAEDAEKEGKIMVESLESHWKIIKVSLESHSEVIGQSLRSHWKVVLVTPRSPRSSWGS